MTEPKNKRPISQDRLFQKMSEVVSLRERVAQAELDKFSSLPEQQDKKGQSKNN